jgi:hypothetical protein
MVLIDGLVSNDSVMVCDPDPGLDYQLVYLEGEQSYNAYRENGMFTGGYLAVKQ